MSSLSGMRSTLPVSSRSAAPGYTSKPRPVYSLTVEWVAYFALTLAQSKPVSAASPKVEACLCARRPRGQSRAYKKGFVLDGYSLPRWPLHPALDGRNGPPALPSLEGRDKDGGQTSPPRVGTPGRAPTLRNRPAPERHHIDPR